MTDSPQTPDLTITPPIQALTLMACLDNDFTDTLKNLTAHNFATVFCCTDDVRTVIEFGVASFGINP